MTRNYFNFMKYKWLYFGVSLLILIPGVYSLIRYGLRLSIDFVGGTLIEIQTRTEVSSQKVSQAVQAAGYDLYSIQSSSDKTFLLRLKTIDATANEKLQSELNQKLEGAIERRFETVGPTIGRQLTVKAALSLLLASVFIVIYIAWSFKSIPAPYSPWKFGLSAVAALVHDALVVIGLFSLLGHLYHVEVDSLFVTAVLTVIGFSVHDTIVVFDRVRENLRKLPHLSFEQVADFSLTETLGRSLNTSLTVILTLTALLLFGGQSIRWFVVALLVGITSGTYSSIFNATPLLVLWEKTKTDK